jgi:hypothetical protein
MVITPDTSQATREVVDRELASKRRVLSNLKDEYRKRKGVLDRLRGEIVPTKACIALYESLLEYVPPADNDQESP